MGPEGFCTFEYDAKTAAWAKAALFCARQIAADPRRQTPENLRHQRTWFVGVDALPNEQDGSIDRVPLQGPWQGHLPELPLHPAQLSIVYEGYPKRDSDESEGNHRYRLNRFAAHVDGVMPIGPMRRRYAKEFHAYILCIPLNHCPASPTVVWRGSQRIMQAAIRGEIAQNLAEDVDITDVYQQARKRVFAECEPVPLMIKPGEAAVMHPFLLHGTQPWGQQPDPTGEGRLIAFFRPEFAGGASEWLSA